MPPTPNSTDRDRLTERILDGSPTYWDRRQAAGLLREHLFPVHERSLERWPVPTRRINGRALALGRDWLDEAFRRIDAAPLMAA